jgi:hypothetical protein
MGQTTFIKKQGHQISVVIDSNYEDSKLNTISASSAITSTQNNKSLEILGSPRRSIDLEYTQEMQSVDIQVDLPRSHLEVPQNLNLQELIQEHPSMSLREFLEKMLIYKQ